MRLPWAYYPPYHSKYNPVERTFGWLEKHWNGSLLDSLETVLKFASTLTFKGKQPIVTFVEEVYYKGVKLSKQEMGKIEAQIERLPDLKKWADGRYWVIHCSRPQSIGSFAALLINSTVSKRLKTSQQ